MLIGKWHGNTCCFHNQKCGKYEHSSTCDLNIKMLINIGLPLRVNGTNKWYVGLLCYDCLFNVAV